MWLILAVSVVLLIIIIYFINKNKSIKAKDDFSVYKLKDFLLTRTEKNVYHKLLEILSKNKIQATVLPKIRLNDFVWTPRENRNAYLRIQAKFVDFLIVELPSLKPKIAIFLINEENKLKMQSLNIIEPVIDSTKLNFIKTEPKDVFDKTFETKIVEVFNDNK